jgi:hypothetical protein
MCKPFGDGGLANGVRRGVLCACNRGAGVGIIPAWTHERTYTGRLAETDTNLDETQMGFGDGEAVRRLR